MPSVNTATSATSSQLTARAQEAREERRAPTDTREVKREEREKPKASTNAHTGRKVDIRA